MAQGSDATLPGTARQRLTPRRVLIGANPRHSEVTEAVLPLEEALARRSIEVRHWREKVDPRQALEGVDLVVVLGGDGFMMSIIRALQYPQVPFFGVNFGRVGFLMNPIRSGAQLASLFVEGLFAVNLYPVLKGTLLRTDGGHQVIHAFNDFVLERGTGQTVHLRTAIDDVLLNEYSGDGLIVATPGGSTAYSLAAGGPVVHHRVPGMLVTPLNPHRPVQFHSLQFPLLVPLESRVHIGVQDWHKRPVRCTADGQQVDGVREVDILDSGLRVTLLRVPEYEFIDTLVRKIIGRSSTNIEELQE